MKKWIMWLVITAIVTGLGVLIYINSRPGEPPVSQLGGGTGMSTVELRTKDIAALEEFYTDAVGLSVRARTEDAVLLGTRDETLLRLVSSDFAADSPAQAGLYHSAFLFPDESSLAHALVRASRVAPNAFQGASDHRVSQAFYYADPEGNGVELYVDRPEEEWRWSRDGYVTMGSAALDPNNFVLQHQSGVDPRADRVQMGHVHLRVGDLAEAERFYVDIVGFAVTARSTGALFFGANGYHHHVAANIWSSDGAGERLDSLGLGSLAIRVADEAELDALEERLKAAGQTYQRNENTIIVSDPWGTSVVVRAA